MKKNVSIKTFFLMADLKNKQLKINSYDNLKKSPRSFPKSIKMITKNDRDIFFKTSGQVNTLIYKA